LKFELCAGSFTLTFFFLISYFNILINPQDIDGLNIYDILEPCYHGTDIREIATDNIRLPSSFRRLGETERPLAVRKRMFGRAWPLRAPVRDGYVPTWPQLINSNNVPCTVRYVYYYTSNFFVSLVPFLYW
jgi:hypothetical protein